MKKMQALFLSVFFLLLCVTACKMETASREFTYGGIFNYRVEKSKAYITGLQSTAANYVKGGVLTLPQEMQAIPVAGIDAYAFKNSSAFKTLRLLTSNPPSLGEGALDGIADLSILVPTGTVSIYANSPLGFGAYGQFLKDDSGTLPGISNDITAIRMEGLYFSYSEKIANDAVMVWIGDGEQLTNLQPVITHTGKRIEPASGAEQDFTEANPAAAVYTEPPYNTDGFRYLPYTVFAENNEAKQWKIVVNNRDNIAVLRFDPNGGQGTVFSQAQITGKILKSITSQIHSRAGYTLQGYFDAASGGNQYYNESGAAYNDKTWDKIVYSYTLYARWEGKRYEVSFDQNGGTGEKPANVTATSGSPMPQLTAAAPKKSGNTFGGYYDALSGGTQYYTAAMTSARNWDKTEPTILYARWSETVYSAANYNSYPDFVDIHTPAQLKQIADMTNDTNAANRKNFAGKTVRLHADLDMTKPYTNTSVTPNYIYRADFRGISVGSTSYEFRGNFDGNNKTVTVNINQSIDSVGFIGKMYTQNANIEIKNLTIAGNIKGGSYTGGIVGYASPSSSSSYSVTLTGCTNTAQIDGLEGVGGLIGRAYDAVSIINGKNTGKVISNYYFNVGGFIGLAQGSTITITGGSNSGAIQGSYNVGGIVGGSYAQNCTVSGLTNSGDVTSTGAMTESIIGMYKWANTGGIIGFMDNFGTRTITSCGNTGTISTTSGEPNLGGLGGIAGYLKNGAVVEKSYNLGTIKLKGNQHGFSGGIAGVMAGGTISRCYNKGTIWKPANDYASVGGIAGFVTRTTIAINNTIENCYSVGGYRNLTGGALTDAAHDGGGLVGEVYHASQSFTLYINQCYVISNDTLRGRSFINNIIGSNPRVSFYPGYSYYNYDVNFAVVRKNTGSAPTGGVHIKYSADEWRTISNFPGWAPPAWEITTQADIYGITGRPTLINVGPLTNR